MYHALLIFFLLISILLVGCIMLQQGKGTDVGASFGVGASTSLFGSNGSGNFMTRMTSVLATLFFIISLILGNIATNKKSEWENLNQPEKSGQAKKTENPVNKPQTDIPQ
ncbi:preprotein translocase subunit SecG [Candidatus Williamhamiltonella defendens]|uniref:Protein-export membrane protein SecG n=1 Tax=Candidatus Williamhamiltonella defendens TaxID=138072 RepID=A0A2D3TEB2_9ENTR|nr:preprotein translocase subunit SecG [Candidatus Hamiltonella defensa]ASV32974.1 preprotein translocase subunit SecG [Candidatus Hamiltonella defensa]ATW30208.1 preprotein translocase subunit SecG [Candidatus Hamiltonella defensa]ATW32220.1 preprotein translocase subunit SecG [Candidatus Hamiltonella defensa]ATW34152.1 preprotein translocase subunit SecG [Candidatus Hamiltonella defensa]AWK15926.1 preprotein translocase subunit SecG [Candidatus Hamiltonella defensa]